MGREIVVGRERVHGNAGRVGGMDRGELGEVGVGKRVVASVGGGHKTHGRQVR